MQFISLYALHRKLHNCITVRAGLRSLIAMESCLRDGGTIANINIKISHLNEPSIYLVSSHGYNQPSKEVAKVIGHQNVDLLSWVR